MIKMASHEHDLTDANRSIIDESGKASPLVQDTDQSEQAINPSLALSVSPQFRIPPNNPIAMEGASGYQHPIASTPTNTGAVRKTKTVQYDDGDRTKTLESYQFFDAQLADQLRVYHDLCVKEHVLPTLPCVPPYHAKLDGCNFHVFDNSFPVQTSATAAKHTVPPYSHAVVTSAPSSTPPVATRATTSVSSPQQSVSNTRPDTTIDLAMVSQQIQHLQGLLQQAAEQETHSTKPTTVAPTITTTSSIPIPTPEVRPPLQSNLSYSAANHMPWLHNQTMFRMAPQGINPLARVTPSKITSKHTEHSFHQLESWMTLNGYTTDEEKFNALKVFIEPETYEVVAPMIYNPPTVNKYNTLKAAIIKAFTDSETKNIHKLLSGLQLGDRRPSQLLVEMCKLYKGPKDKIFRELFLARLPPNVRGILVAAPSQPGVSPMSMENLAQWADNIMEQTSSAFTISAISPSGPSQLSQLQSQVDKLSKQLDKLLSNRSRPRSRSVSRSRSQSKNDKRMCFFHYRYGEGKHANRKCKDDCPLHEEWLAHQQQNKSEN